MNILRSQALIFLIFFGGFLTFSQESETISIDSIQNVYFKAADAYEATDYEGSIFYSSQVIDMATSTKQDYYLFLGYDLLGSLYADRDEYEKAKLHAKKALEIALESKTDSLISWGYLNLGNVYSEHEEEFRIGIDYFKKSIAIHEKTNNEKEIFLIYINLAWTYMDHNDFDAGYHILMKAREISTRVEVPVADDGYLSYLFGRFYSQKKHYTPAGIEYEHAIAVAEQEKMPSLLANVYESIVNMYAGKRDFEKAYIYQKKLQELDKQTYDREKIVAIERESAKLSLGETKKAMELAQKEKEYSDRLVDKSRQITTIFVISTFVLVIVLIAFFGMFKNRKKLVDRLSFNNIELTKAKEEAERLSKVKSQFFSTVSHELRTPLYGVIGIASILQDDNKLKKYEQDLASLKFSADYLLALINDVLLLSKMDSEKIVLAKNSFQLDGLVNSIIRSFKFNLEQNNNKLHINIDNRIPDKLVGDSVRFSQILMNLIGNATKFNENGNIWFNVKLLKINEDGTYRTRFKIKDDGIGISEDKQDFIFSEFSQIETKNLNYQGTGLGLPIVKKLLELHGSDIKLKSELGKGSEFIFELDLEVDKASTRVEMQPVDISDRTLDDIELSQIGKKRILVVDDNKINQKVTQKILEKYNFSSSVANDGEEAIEAVRDNDFCLVLMDINMPRMNGIEATEEIRKFNPHIPIIALTAVELEEMRIKIKESGMNDIISKPYDVPKFLNTIVENLTADNLRKV